jgi:hypothetical protein
MQAFLNLVNARAYYWLARVHPVLFRLAASRRAELDEKALLIALFVIAAIAGLTTLATAVSARFTNLAGRL